MKALKKISLFILGFLLILLAFRGQIYRSIVSYNTIGERVNYTINKQKLKANFENCETNGNINDIISAALDNTSKTLTFSSTNTQNNPNLLINSHKAHCVGYASFFTLNCNYLLKKHGLSVEWKAKHKIGHLYMFGTNIHKFFDSSFFKDHDFVIIENIKTGKTIAVDPTVNDYLWIDEITYE